MHVGKEQRIVLALRWARAVPCQMLHSLRFLSFYRARTKYNSFGSYVLIAACASYKRVKCCCLAFSFKDRNGHLSIVDFSMLKKEQSPEGRKATVNKTGK